MRRGSMNMLRGYYLFGRKSPAALSADEHCVGRGQKA